MFKPSLIIGIIIVALTLVIGCEEEAFYQEYTEWDVRAAPIINPYYIASTTGTDGTWYLLNGTMGTETTHVGVVDSIIVSFSFNKHITDPNIRDTTWYLTTVDTGLRFNSRPRLILIENCKSSDLLNSPSFT